MWNSSTARGPGAQAHRRRRFQVRQTPALRWRAVGPANRSRSRAGFRRRQPAAAGRRHPRACRIGRRRLPPAIPIQIGVGIDQITLGGNTVQNLRGDISTDSKGWNLDRFEFRAPGFTQVRLSGHLAVGADDVAFTGPAEIEAGDPKALAAWLEGRSETAQGDLRPLSLRGDVTLASERSRSNVSRPNSIARPSPAALPMSLPPEIGPRNSTPNSTHPSSISTPRSASATPCSPAPISSGRTT